MSALRATRVNVSPKANLSGAITDAIPTAHYHSNHVALEGRFCRIVLAFAARCCSAAGSSATPSFYPGKCILFIAFFRSYYYLTFQNYSYPS